MRLALVLLLASLSAVAGSPSAQAAAKSAGVQVHDLTERGAYVGCHVTDVAFATFRLAVREGDVVTLRVQAPANNTNAHSLTVEGHDAATRPLTAGQSQDVTFTAGAPRSYGVLCDGDPGSLKGILIVQRAASEPTKDAAFPGVVAFALALPVALGLARKRA